MNGIKKTIFSIILVMSMLPAIAHQPTVNPAVNENPFATVSLREIMNNLGPLIQARGVNEIAQGLKDLAITQVKNVLTDIIQEENSPLTSEDKIKLWVLSALSFSGRPDAQRTILNLYEIFELMRKDKAVLFEVAHLKEAPQIIPMVLKWIEYIQKNPAIMSGPLRRHMLEMPIRACTFAVTKNDFKALEVLLRNGVMLLSSQSTDLLWLVVEGNKKSEFIPLLVAHGADINADRKGYSPLMKAVKNNNMVLTQVLVKAGAKIDTIYNPAVGNALQIAIEKGHAAIDQFLRAQGAKEAPKIKK